jgi:regulator of chromosome condensation
VAGVKYIKKTKDAEVDAPAKRNSTTRAAANTKAKVATKAEAKPAATTTTTTTTTGRGRGRPKATDPKPAKAEEGALHHVRQLSVDQQAKNMSEAPKRKPGRPKKVVAATAAPAEAKTTTLASRKRKATATPEPAVAKKTKVAAKGPVINAAPTQLLDVFVFGEGSSGELGLGTSKKAIDVKRPRLNPNLAASSVGVVQIVAGGMHVVALTHDNKILTWGVNDQGALGRDTTWEGGLRDMEAEQDSDSEDEDADSGMNPNEATPTAIDSDLFPDDTVFVQVTAGDSASFALTDDGQVWGWGTFRCNEGIFGFTTDITIQRTPMLIPGLKKIKHVSCGANHVLALDVNGSVFAWGCGQQNQLGRRVVERTKTQGLVPREFGLPKKAIKYVECGGYHSFAIDTKDRVWAWGLNNFGETGISDNAGEDDAVILKPAVVEALSGKQISCIKGGSHHSIAVTGAGECLVWGRLDGSQCGIPISELPDEATIKDASGNARILADPTVVKAVQGKVVFATASSDHSFAITDEGHAYSWGFSANYQTGQGTDEDVEVATKIDNTATRGRQINFVTSGGQFSILTAPAQSITNGDAA